MTRPRCIFPGKFWMLTRRCTQGQFLLRPDKETNNLFLYCLIEAAQRHDVGIVLPQLMSNHHHTLVYDPDGNVIPFMERFHGHVARCQNHHLGRWGSLWNSSAPNVLELVEVTDVVEKLIYAATNPVLSHLVAKVEDWPGPAAVEALLSGKPVTATRPRFFRDDGTMPATVTATFELPEMLGDRALLVREIRDGIAKIEAQCAEQRRTTGRQVVGAYRILRQSWKACPTTDVPHRSLNPRVACKRPSVRRVILLRNREFQSDYRIALRARCAGRPAVFPAGTDWLRRHANVTVAEPKPIPPELFDR